MRISESEQVCSEDSGSQLDEDQSPHYELIMIRENGNI